MSNMMTIHSHTFEGGALSTIIYRGRPCWIARDVGAILGYSKEGARLADKVRGEWADEFIDSRDSLLLSGADLNHLRGLLEVSTNSVETSPGISKYAPSQLVLFESGLHLVLAKTSKPVGKKLRRFLVDDVLPQIMRDGNYSPDRHVIDGRIVARDEMERDRLGLERDRLAVEKARLAADSLWKLHAVLESLPGLAPESRAAIAYAAAEAASGRDLKALKPAAPDAAGWESPTEIASRLGISVQRVGLAITALGLRGPGAKGKEMGLDGLSRRYITKAQSSNREVYPFVYSRPAVVLVERYLCGGEADRSAALADACSAVEAATAAAGGC